jgi:hypothetical protein
MMVAVRGPWYARIIDETWCLVSNKRNEVVPEREEEEETWPVE